VPAICRAIATVARRTILRAGCRSKAAGSGARSRPGSKVGRRCLCRSSSVQAIDLRWRSVPTWRSRRGHDHPPLHCRRQPAGFRALTRWWQGVAFMIASRSAASNGADVTWPCFLLRRGSFPLRLAQRMGRGRLALGPDAHQDSPMRPARGTSNGQKAFQPGATGEAPRLP